MDDYKFPLGAIGENVIGLLVRHAQPEVNAFAWACLRLDHGFRDLLSAAPPYFWVIVFGALVWRFSNRKTALFCSSGLLLLWNQKLWSATIATLSLVLTSTLLSLMIAIPLGIALAESRAVRNFLNPVLDFLQTMPRFVYLIPALVLFGIDVPPAVFATMTLAIPPAARFTSTGLMQVDERMVEAAKAFGASPWRILTGVKLPLAAPAILVGSGQALMMALSMAVIASLIGAEGLGEEVLRAIAVLNAGQGFVAGFGIFVLAVLLERVATGCAARASARHGRFGRDLA
jgi:ABC-type proline/glycine betaine transport system permease subunit